jgi:hypothetical protein
VEPDEPAFKFQQRDTPARAFEAGALGYVTKNASVEQISLAIIRVAAGHNYIEPEIAQEFALLTVRTSGQSPLSHPFKDLTPRDLEILRLLGEGYSANVLVASHSRRRNHSFSVSRLNGRKRWLPLRHLSSPQAALRQGLASRGPK